jgi:ribosome maturation factor RimP
MHPAQELANQIRKTADGLLSGRKFFVLDVTVSSTKVGRIRLVLDGDKGVTIDDCAEISRELNQLIDGLKLLEDYNLEITTPGVDQPLRNFRQYPKHIGRQLKVEFNDGRSVQGKLLQASQQAIIIEEEVKKVKGKPELPAQPLQIPFENIKKTFVIVSFK